MTNSGHLEGDEIVQLYVRFPEARIERPIKQLANFDRVHLKAGETKTVSFELAYEHEVLRYLVLQASQVNLRRIEAVLPPGRR